MPRVTAVVPLYNHRKYVEAAVRSLRDQTYRDMEIVIADDGSQDGSIDVLGKVRSSVRFLFGPHGGPAAARNRALEHTNSEFVAFMDADDLARPDRIARQMEAITSGGFDLVASALSFIDAEGRALPGVWAAPAHAHRDYWGALIERNWIGTPGVLARRAALEQVGYFDTNFTHAEDYDLWLRAGRGRRIGYVPEALIQCRRHGENTSNNLDAHRRFEMNALAKVAANEARAALERLHPNRQLFEEAWIWFLLRSENTELEAELQRALKAFPQSSSLEFSRGVMLCDRGRTREAAGVFEKLSPDPAALNNAAVCRQDKGGFAAALRARPDYRDARFNLEILEGGSPADRITRRPFRESLVPMAGN